MNVKLADGMQANLATNGKANAALATGIIGTTLGALNTLGAHGGFSMGRGYGNYGCQGDCTNPWMAQDEISKLRMRNAILESENDTDKKIVDAYTVNDRKYNELRDRIDALRENFGEKLAIEHEGRLIAEGKQAVLNSQYQTGLDVLGTQQSAMAKTLAAITKSVVPSSVVVDTSCCGCNA